MLIWVEVLLAVVNISALCKCVYTYDICTCTQLLWRNMGVSRNTPRLRTATVMV